MRAFFSQLRTRLVLAALVFLVALTIAVVLTVRDSLLFSARDTARLSAQQMAAQGETALLEITRREAELTARDLPADRLDLARVQRRLDQLHLAPHAIAFVVDAAGRLAAVTAGQAGALFGAAATPDTALLGHRLSEAQDPILSALGPRLAAGDSAVTRLDLDGAAAVLAYAPLLETGWALGVVVPETELAAGADTLSQTIQTDINRTLQATLLTIAYFAALAVVGVFLAAGTLTRPIQTLAAGTRAIAAGDLTTRLPLTSNDEIGQLAGAFNHMADELLTRNTELLKLSSAVEQSGDIVFITDRAGVIEYVNVAFTTLTGYAPAEALGQTPRLLKSGEHTAGFYERLWQTILAGEVFRAEIVNRRKDGAAYVEEKTIAPLKDPQGRLTHFVSTGKDVTERRQAERALRASEERLRLITEVTTDALYEWDITAGKTRWNHSYRTLFGYPVEGSHEHVWWRERVHPEDLAAAVAQLEAAFQNRAEFISFEYRYRRVDETYAYVVDRGYIFYDAAGRPQRLVGAMIDITDRVRLTEAQTRAALEERQRLARELHDSVTQSLYSLTLLAEAGRRTAAAGDLDKTGGFIARLGETAQQALKEMRLLVFELRPLALETEGLVEALQHRLDAVEKRAGLQAHLRAGNLPDLSAAVEHGLYRIAQEALNNALKHAAATVVTVTLSAAAGRVALEIADNGRGFEAAALPDGGGLGLVSIRERAETLGGQALITSQPGAGTRVKVSVPA
ncbi:MAG: PAS domain S-box protein [Anaerolineales bacterium]|nr:PAS domain S-box protein [Anaerolineales bacterium]